MCKQCEAFISEHCDSVHYQQILSETQKKCNELAEHTEYGWNVIKLLVATQVVALALYVGAVWHLLPKVW